MKKIKLLIFLTLLSLKVISQNVIVGIPTNIFELINQDTIRNEFIIVLYDSISHDILTQYSIVLLSSSGEYAEAKPSKNGEIVCNFIKSNLVYIIRVYNETGEMLKEISFDTKNFEKLFHVKMFYPFDSKLLH